MTSFVANKVAKHLLKENAENHFGTEDPYFEYVEATDRTGRPTGKTIKRKRAIPPGLTKQEEKVLKKVTRRAHRLDNCMNICGVKVGWGAIIAIVPFIGDGLDSFAALMVVWTCSQVKLPPALQSRMLLNVVFDFFIGLVPFLGDVADAFYRCNTRNAALLYKHLQGRGAARIKKAGGEQQGSLRQQRERSQNRQGKQSRDPSRKREDKANEPLKPQGSQSANTSTNDPQASRYVTPNDIEAPAPVKTSGSHGPKRSGWLGRFATSSSTRDLEHDGHEMTPL